MLKLRDRNLIIARIVCFASALLIAFILSGFDSVNGILEKVRNGIGTESVLIPFAFWILLVLIMNDVLMRIVRSIWLQAGRTPENTGLIRNSDICINTNRSIRNIPAYRIEFENILNSAKNNVIEAVNTLISIGFSLSASDIHINPDPEKVEVILRIQGNLYSIGEIPQQLYSNFARRIKILSGLSIYKQSIPQDGQLYFEDKSYTARVAVFPTANGERIAMRLVNVHARIMDIESIGMPQNVLLDSKALLNRSQGMIIITGPTGSGKSTTMFSSLLHIQKLRQDSVNIVTLEDPIETNLEGFFQTQVGQNTGLTFSTGLRSVLRQDPDVIMLGEIRDEETATIAIRAAMTGHLLLTTVHASSTAGVFNRLSQMGIDPVDLSSTVHAVISQRLCRQLCPACRKETQLTDAHVRQLKLLGVNDVPEGPFFESDGCTKCLGHGFTGRVALFEILVVTDLLRDFISKGCPAYELSKEACKAGMTTLLDHGLKLARNGTISLMELTRIVSD